ncbi:MAG: ABC transporter ATP-binding protein [Minisyncoccia bacterium]
MKKYWLSFSLIFIFYTIGIIFDNILKPLVFKAIIDLFSSGLARDFILHQVMYLFLVICFILIVQNIGYRIGDFTTAHFESKVMKRLYDFTFAKLLQHSYNFFSNNFSGSLIAKSRRFVNQFETLMDIVSFQIWFSFVTITSILIVLFLKIPPLAWAFLIWSGFYILIIFLFMRKKIIYDAQEAAADSFVTGRFSDAITNILNIKIFSSNKIEENNFKIITEDEENKRRRAWFFANFQNVAGALMMAILQIFVLFLDIHFWYEGRISLGMFVLIQTYMFSLFDVLWNLGRSFTRAMKAMTDMQEVVDIFDTPIDILDTKTPENLKMQKGHIILENVSFAYKGGFPVLQNFNLDIAPGERIGIVGHSGAGKSTITKILLRFADISNGSVTIDGQNIQKLTQNDLRSVISYVPQESILFHRSIRENIAYGKPGATEIEIFEVAKKAHADEFISRLPQKYETLVGERGVKLSGGERQRVAIARAMLKDSPILMLDEATSSLDSVSEHYIQDAFNELMKGKTTIVIAHRLSTIQKMDRIIVLDQGKIVEEGTHKELLDKGGVYANLWSHQTGAFLD